MALCKNLESVAIAPQLLLEEIPQRRAFGYSPVGPYWCYQTGGVGNPTHRGFRLLARERDQRLDVIERATRE